jgi:hypothetical protein
MIKAERATRRAASSHSSFAVRAMEARANEARVWLFSGL